MNKQPPNATVLFPKTHIQPANSSNETNRIVNTNYTAVTNTKSNTNIGANSLNSLLLSTSVPIKIGSEKELIGRDSHKNNRIRYTFGLNTIKKSIICDQPKHAKFNGSNSNNKSMESICLDEANITDKMTFKNRTNIEPMPTKCHADKESKMMHLVHIEPSHAIETKNPSGILPEQQSETTFCGSSNKSDSKFVKQTTIDYYV